MPWPRVSCWYEIGVVLRISSCWSRSRRSLHGAVVVEVSERARATGRIIESSPEIEEHGTHSSHRTCS